MAIICATKESNTPRGAKENNIARDKPSFDTVVNKSTNKETRPIPDPNQINNFPVLTKFFLINIAPQITVSPPSDANIKTKKNNRSTKGMFMTAIVASCILCQELTPVVPDAINIAPDTIAKKEASLFRLSIPPWL